MIVQSKTSREIFMWYSTDDKKFTTLRTKLSETSEKDADWYAAHENNKYLGPFELTRWKT